MTKIALAPLFAAALISGCGGDSSEPAGAKGCLPECAGTRDYDAQAYALRGSFDWARQRLVASEDITLVPGKTRPAVVTLDSAVEVSRVHAGNTSLPYAVDESEKTLRVDLSSLSPGSAPVSFTVEYEAPTSTSLAAFSGRDHDPVTSRMVFTDSEPDRGRYWLVANHRPADRARWSVELTVAADEDVIANGSRVDDRKGPGGRLVRYEITEPLPTYLMAFAAGQLDHQDRPGRRVPLSVWYRRGLLIDAEQHLDVIVDAMGTFEKLLGPYPWDRYSVVLVPDGRPFTGMENATITFNTEPSGQNVIDFGVNAHELSHHWIGDWVTVSDFDDLWVKEGMATLLQSEADRARRAADGDPRLFGIDFPATADSIRDRTLTGLDRYTAGPSPFKVSSCGLLPATVRLRRAACPHDAFS